MAEYPYPVYFDLPHLSEGHGDKIKKYFQIKRKSGGGDCGPLDIFAGDTYMIAFKEQEAQERVLNIKEHVVTLPSGEVRFSVRSKASPAPGNLSASPQLNDDTHSAPLGNQQEKTVSLDPYLLQYLKHCPQAGKNLQVLLSPVSSSFDLHPEEEKVVVRGVAKEGQTSKWEALIDDVFEKIKRKYSYHYVSDQLMLETLTKSSSFGSEDVQVYKELAQGFAVIVGEAKHVQKKVLSLEVLLQKQETRMQCKVSEMQYHLVEKQFENEFRSHHPAVKVTREGPELLVLKGPHAEVQEGHEKLLNLVQEIQEERVPLSAALLAFLESSGAIQRFQARFCEGLRAPVILKLEADLGLFSLSREALKEAAAIITKDLHLETVTLEASSSMEELKKTLSDAQQQANQQENRIQVIYEQGAAGSSTNRVHLVGYIKEVYMLKQVLLNYQFNQVEIQKSVALPHEKMVDVFFEILELTKLNNPGVRFRPSHLPSPCVVLSGPQYLVQELQDSLSQALSHLSWNVVHLTGPGVLQFLHGDGARVVEQLCNSCHVIIYSMQQETNSNYTVLSPSIQGASIAASPPGQTQGDNLKSKVGLEVILGNVEDQQVDVLVAPMLNTELLSTQVGKALSKKAGQQLNHTFKKSTRWCNLAPGDVLKVPGSSTLRCQWIYFIQCLPWGRANSQAEQALRRGLSQVLELCEQQSLASVAFPVIGPGIALQFPPKKAVNILIEELGKFGRKSPQSVTTVQIVVKQSSPDSSEMLLHMYQGLKQLVQDQSTSQTIFTSLITDMDDLTVAVREIQLELVFGDITDETTDVIVNTTDFANFDSGVCRDILDIAGGEIEKKLSASVGCGEILETEPGWLPIRALIHVNGEKNPSVIQSLAKKIVQRCELRGYTSVAIPAICAGKGALDPWIVADAILNGISNAMLVAPLQCLSTVRLVVTKINVFLEFKRCLQTHFGVVQPRKASRGKSQEVKTQPSPRPDLGPLWNLGQVHSSTKLLVIGLCNEAVASAMQKLKQAYEDHSYQQEMSVEELTTLTQEDIAELASKMAALGVQAEPDRTQSGVLFLRGLRNAVEQVCHPVESTIRKNLSKEVQKQKQDEIYAQVAWCFQEVGSNWERFPPQANYLLEKGDVSGAVKDGKGMQWTVDWGKMEATNKSTNQIAKLKRLENLPDFSLPLNWDSMPNGQLFQTFILNPSSSEYQQVRREFKKVSKTIIKIERIQNIRLRQSYEVLKKQLEDKNGPSCGAMERVLFHGTTSAACDSIQRTGFSRSFAGQNATKYGVGVYFAVDASYSEHPTYSIPEADGSQRMFMALVLTGQHTLGTEDMKVPPQRSPLQSDRYDSLVNDLDNPKIFVVFHDSQAYPEYLITFK